MKTTDITNNIASKAASDLLQEAINTLNNLRDLAAQQNAVAHGCSQTFHAAALGKYVAKMDKIVEQLESDIRFGDFPDFTIPDSK